MQPLPLQLTVPVTSFHGHLLGVLPAISWWGVLAAFAVYFLLGGLWYTVLFKEVYKVSLGKANQDLQNQSSLYVVGPALCVLAVVLVSAVLLTALDISTYSGALQFALVVGLGYLVANTTNIAINPNIPRPFLYSLITSSYHLLSITLASLLLVALR
jgi:hypothetical protein